MVTTETTTTAITCDLDGAPISRDRVVRLALVDAKGRGTQFTGSSPRKADVCPECAAKPGLAELLAFLHSPSDPEEIAALMKASEE